MCDGFTLSYNICFAVFDFCFLEEYSFQEGNGDGVDFRKRKGDGELGGVEGGETCQYVLYETNLFSIKKILTDYFKRFKETLRLNIE